LRIRDYDILEEQRPDGALNLLVIDDSAVVRQVIKEILSADRSINVSTAADPIIAMEKMKRSRPHVILLDLEMPRMDGLTFLRKLMSEDPIPVVICSGYAEAGTGSALRALEEGAVEVITKPKLGVMDFLKESAVLLSDTVRAASQARLKVPQVRRTKPLKLPSAPLNWVPQTQRIGQPSNRLIAMGASTGGTEALRVLLKRMPSDCPGIVIVQHMPEGFTAAFAERLNQICPILVKEARDGDPIVRGQALVAPGNKHMMVRQAGAGFRVEVADGPLISRHRPSVDVLFRSLARVAGPLAIGVILTGMGKDGAEGLFEMRRAGAVTIAQDEATSVVFGMPRESINRGAVEQVVPLNGITDAILRRASMATGPLRSPRTV
jgi:two-component system chemotaxis response regulator CheB